MCGPQQPSSFAHADHEYDTPEKGGCSIIKTYSYMPGSRNTQTSAETRSALDTSQQMQRYTLSPQYLQVHADTWSASHESQSMQIHTHPQQNTTNTVTRPSPLDTCRHSIQVHTALDTCQSMQTHAQPSTQANKCRYTPKPSRYVQAQHADTRSALDTSQLMHTRAHL